MERLTAPVRTDVINRKKVPVYRIAGEERVVQTDPHTGIEYLTSPAALKSFRTETAHVRFKDEIESLLVGSLLAAPEITAQAANRVLAAALTPFYA